MRRHWVAVLPLFAVHVCLNEAANVEELFIHKSEFLGTTCASATVDNFGTSVNAMECGFECGKRTGCYSFFFNQNTGSCRGLSVIFETACGDTESGNKYYVKGKLILFVYSYH